MRANKLETVLSRDRLASLAPPDMVFLMDMVFRTSIYCGLGIFRKIFHGWKSGLPKIEGV